MPVHKFVTSFTTSIFKTEVFYSNVDVENLQVFYSNVQVIVSFQNCTTTTLMFEYFNVKCINYHIKLTYSWQGNGDSPPNTIKVSY